MDFKLIIIVGLMIASVVLFSLIALSFIVNAKKYEAKKKRLNQLNFKKANNDVSVEEAIEKITKFVDTYVLKITPSQKEQEIEIKLKMIGWDKYFGYKEWKAFRVFMAIVGIVLMIFLSVISRVYGMFVGGVLIIAPDLFFKVQVDEVVDKLLDKFPDLIVITEGYLSAGFTLPKAIEETIPFVGKTWCPILKKLVADMELMGIDYALNGLKEATNIPEVREFASLVKIAYEQGDVGESFTTQAERMLIMQEDLMLKKINGRRSLAAVANAPTILAVFLLVGAPAMEKIMNMGI